MKTLRSVLISSMLVLIGAGCSSQPQSSAQHQPTPVRHVDENERPPFIGMTKGQALARYGEPKARTITSEGERWVYYLNYGAFVGKHMIPFFFSEERLRVGVLIFGYDGRVKRFTWDQPT